ncbi:uncharacterized protein LOC101746612 isoform X1 [Bombyx mori]|uniref:BED-type domain-containing protein n=1 Tax=Bombyx mori TaxID=7091 RepID=A0A8R2ASJ7_BOMMO|nr:uncharacterized protein LOC101746612 isoform X1 [Bombyx mori]
MDRVHSVNSDEESDRTDFESDVENINISSAEKTSRRTSQAWKYFGILDEAKCLARCNLCLSVMSFRTSVSNLMKHVKTKHPFAHSQMKKEIANSEKRSSYTGINNMLKEQKHETTDEDGIKKIFVSTDGKVYEIETEQGDEFSQQGQINATNENEEIKSMMEQITGSPLKKRKRPKHEYIYADVEPKKYRTEYSRNYDASENKIVLQSPEVMDPLDHLAKYLISILKDLPKSVSSELQLKFVQLAVEAQVKCEKDKDVVKIKIPDSVAPDAGDEA